MSKDRFSDLDVTVPAEPEYLQQLRRLVRLFAQRAGASEAMIADMVLAANEACANVIVHAYPEEGGPLKLRAWVTKSRLSIEVSDNGTPVAKPAPGREGGRGLQLIRSVCDDVQIEGPGEYGTRLEMHFAL